MAAADNFSCKPVPWLKDLLKERGIQSSGKRKAELIELCVKSSEIKAPKIAEEEAVVNPVILVNDQLKTPDEGNLPNPLIRECGLSKWTQNFSNVPDFRFPDLFNYLVGKDPGYNPESLKSYKSLLGYKLFFDGHVEDLRYHPPQSVTSIYSYVKFSVKPTEKSKTDDGSTTYKRFFILKKDGSVHSAYCPCKGGYVLFTYVKCVLFSSYLSESQ